MDERMKTHGDLGWCELMTDEVETAREFYTGVIGWSSEVMDVGKGPCTMFKIGDRPVAGLMAEPPAAAGYRPRVRSAYYGRVYRHISRRNGADIRASATKFQCADETFAIKSLKFIPPGTEKFLKNESKQILKRPPYCRSPDIVLPEFICLKRFAFDVNRKGIPKVLFV